MIINPVQDDDGELLEFVRQIVRDELSLARRIEKRTQDGGKRSAIDPDSLRRSADEKSALIHRFYQELINHKFISDHPHAGFPSRDEELRCPRCGATSRERAGTYTATVIRYTQWRCTNCSGLYRSGRHSRAGLSRAV